MSSAQKLLGIKEEQLKLPCRISWEFICDMFNSLVRNEKAIERAIKDETLSTTRQLSPDDWNNIEWLINLLEPFNMAAILMSPGQIFTISMIRPLMHRIIKHFLEIKDDDSLLIKNFKEKVGLELTKFLDETTLTEEGDVPCTLISEILGK